MFYENGMTVNDLKTPVDRAIEHGFGDAIVQVQTDGISDIGINGFEGFGERLENGPKIFSLISVKDEQQFKTNYLWKVVEKKLEEWNLL